MEIRLLGAHNLESRDARHTCFLVDGVLGLDAGSLVSALSSSEQAEVRALLITHRHFDHTRDIPTLGLATLDDPRHIDVYGLTETLDGIHTHLLDGDVYPDLTKGLNGAAPKYRFHSVEPWLPFQVLTYEVKPIPVTHVVSAVGYIVKSASGDCIAYTGDTGGDLRPFFQDDLEPQVVFVDVTFPNRLEERAMLTGHMTPGILRNRLIEAFEDNMRIPRIVPVHISLVDREEVAEELKSVATELGVDLTPGYEGMIVSQYHTAYSPKATSP